jgi:PEP-CTERM motif
MIGALLTRSRQVLCVVLLCSVSGVPSLWAEPVTVTSGLFVVAWDDPNFFHFSGTDGFFLNGGFFSMASSPQQTCMFGAPVCAPGTVVDMSAVAGGESSVTRFPLGTSARAVVNGVEFDTPFPDAMRLAGTLRFDAPAIVLPPVEPNQFGVKFTAPFVFNGQVTGFAADDLDARVPLFHAELVGQGTADLLLDAFFDSARFGLPPGGLYDAPEVRYNFAAAPAATPEPATLALLGTGFVGLVARARTKRRRVASARRAARGRTAAGLAYDRESF